MSDDNETSSKQQKTTADKDVRLRILKEKQNEDRQRKLEEIRAQAFAAQRFKEQKEQERRQRLEEIRLREDIRRQQVEERKRAINEAERNRLESILQRNQQRENRLETKKRHERSNLVFAFGSSTPRNLDPHDVNSSFWGQRRATSTQNITACSGNPFSRRTTERNIENGSKKRATSAGASERTGESSLPTTPAGCASGYLGRRRTDLMPTIPSRDSLSSTSRKSLSHSPASSRPSSSMSQHSTTSITSSVIVRHSGSSHRKPRPASIAITGVSSIQDKKQESAKPPLPKRKSIEKSLEKVSKSKPSTTPKSLLSPSGTRVFTKVEGEENGDVGGTHKKPPDTIPAVETQQSKDTLNGITTAQKATTEGSDVLVNENVLKNGFFAPQTENDRQTSTSSDDKSKSNSQSELVEVKENHVNNSRNLPQVVDTKVINDRKSPEKTTENNEPPSDSSVLNKDQLIDLTSSVTQIGKETSEISNEMTASQYKAKINTEEEAKAAIAERRRLAKEEAARRAEQERLRIEAELEKQRHEEEQVRLLIEAQRAAEEQRLNEAILETQKREQEEQQRKEEEIRLRALKEEADRKARLEAEKQKAEQQERLIKEEREREARRKRVEAIMLRTRGKSSANSQQNSEDSYENKPENEVNGSAKQVDEQNGHNYVREDLVDNIIQEQPVKNANSASIETITSATDSMNSNNFWQTAPKQFGNFVSNNNS